MYIFLKTVALRERKKEGAYYDYWSNDPMTKEAMSSRQLVLYVLWELLWQNTHNGG